MTTHPAPARPRTATRWLAVAAAAAATIAMVAQLTDHERPGLIGAVAAMALLTAAFITLGRKGEGR